MGRGYTPWVYEIGGGYNWKKKPDVTIDASDVVIFQVEIEDILNDEYDW